MALDQTELTSSRFALVVLPKLRLFHATTAFLETDLSLIFARKASHQAARNGICPVGGHENSPGRSPGKGTQFDPSPVGATDSPRPPEESRLDQLAVIHDLKALLSEQSPILEISQPTIELLAILLDRQPAKPEAKPTLEADLKVLSRVFRKTNQIATQPAE